jgi:hypothetical protein
VRSLLARPNTVLAVVLMVTAVTYLAAARAHRLGSVASPGPGFFPVLLGGTLLACALLLLLWEIFLLRRAPGVGVQPSVGATLGREARGRLLTFSTAAVAYPLVAGVAGFETATALGLPALAMVMGERRPAVLIVLALTGAVVAFAVFRRMLGVPLP